MVSCYYDYYGYQRCSYSSWDRWGRWVLLGALIFAAIVLFFVFSCISARRRRRAGRHPLMGTGWAAPGHGPVTYTQSGYNQNSKPGYNGGNSYQMNNQQGGYYGQQDQQPVYTGNTEYAPPAYPPPAVGRR